MNKANRTMNYYILLTLIREIYVDIGEFRKSQPYLKKASEIGASTLNRTKDLYLLLFKVDSAGGKFKTAIEDFQKYKTLNDSIYNVFRSRQIEELKIKYESEKRTMICHSKTKISNYLPSKASYNLQIYGRRKIPGIWS